MMSPAGAEHGRVAMRLGAALEQFVRPNDLGDVYAAETGFLLERNPDTVRAPDVAFVRREQLESLNNHDGYLALAPDLVAEVVSPSDTWSAVESKALDWLEAGCRMVLVVDPTTRTTQVYRTKDRIQVLEETDEIDGDDVVPGWKFEIVNLFS